MKDPYCPNYQSCQLTNNCLPNVSEAKKEYYTTTYCLIDQIPNFEHCKRYQTKLKLQFCPDFVYPDSDMDLDYILDRFEDELDKL